MLSDNCEFLMLCRLQGAEEAEEAREIFLTLTS